MDIHKLIVGNWKMNGFGQEGRSQISEIARKACQQKLEVEVVICPPAILISEAKRILLESPVKVGGQDCHSASKGPHTGDISAEMLAEEGSRYVIVGHSERRASYSETSKCVRKKVAAGFRAGLTPIICVGEGEKDRRSGRAAKFVANQLADSLPKDQGTKPFIVAYEPIWAIGSGSTPTPVEIEEIHGMIRQQLLGFFGNRTIPILYGGSVNKDNARAILSIPGVDGVLVGGASLMAESFWAIVEAARGLKRVTK